MISKDCTITIDKGNASVDEDVYLYKNDMNIQILFTIVNNKYRYTKNTAIDNIIANNKASYAQVKFKKGDIEIDFEEQETKDGAVVLLIKKELIDEDTELGDYSIQIRLFDENKTSVITLPPVENCIHIQRPLFEKAGEDTNIVDQALTDMAVVTYAEPISATNSDGTYNKKTWISKEKITTAELNRMEEGISNVSSQCKDIAKKKFEYPKLNWEKETLNLNYKYGDIRRYGAKCDGVTDDSDVFQWALDNCSPNGISVYIPEDKITVIAKSIVMKSNSTSNYSYKIKSNQYEINNFCILQKCKNLFVGENFYNNTPLFTQLKAIIKNVAIKVDDSINHGTIFKAIKFISSQIEYNFFYHMYTVIEGSLGVGTKFNNNRIQSYEYSFLSSIATLGEYTFEDIKGIYNNANYNINSLNGLLVVSDENSSDFSRYSCQSNDSFLSNNYFSGARTLTNIPEAIFAVESIDSDFIITNNWFEFGKYVISPLIRATNSGTSLIGTYFSNNIFQNFHRFFSPKSFYTSFSFNSNLFYNFNTSKIKTIFSNATDGDIDNFKSGVFVSDINENNVPIYNNFSILNSYFELNSYSIYIDTGTTGKYKAFSICEQNSKFKDNDNLPYFRIKNTDDLLRNNFTCFNMYEKTIPECTNLYATNSFIGRIVFADDGIYIYSWNGTTGEYKKLTTN